MVWELVIALTWIASHVCLRKLFLMWLVNRLIKVLNQREFWFARRSAASEPKKFCIDSDRKLKDRNSIKLLEKYLKANTACLIEPEIYKQAVKCYDFTKLKKAIEYREIEIIDCLIVIRTVFRRDIICTVKVLSPYLYKFNRKPCKCAKQALSYLKETASCVNYLYCLLSIVFYIENFLNSYVH